MSSLRNSSLPLFPDNRPVENLITNKKDNEYLYALSLVKGLGYSAIRRLYESFETPSEIWQSSEEKLLLILKKLPLKNVKNILKEITSKKDEYLERAGTELSRFRSREVNLITDKDEGFPERLKTIDSPPYWLFVEGNPAVISQENSVTVVGTRNPTEEGERNAKFLTSLLVEKGLIIVSGLAEGIDAVTHQTVIDYGGKAVAVLGNGISLVFPASTANIRRQIVGSEGAVITEYFPNDSYNRRRFVYRNRIQAGLGYALFPIQCQKKGGTTHTIRFAEAFNRAVIGVKWGAASPVSQNEVFQLLEESNHPVVDLESDTEKLWLLLKEILPKTIAEISQASTQTKFNSVLKEFNRVIEEYPVSNQEITDLINDIKSLWEKRTDQNGS